MDLLAIAPARRTVTLGSVAVEVTGLSLRKVTQLIVAYPDLAGLIVGGRVDVGLLITHAPEAALASFSLGLVGRARPAWWRRPLPMMITTGEDDLLAAFDAAPAGQQINILSAIYDLTFEGGERALPFVKALLAPKPATEIAPESPPASEPPPTSSETTAPSSSASGIETPGT